MFFKKPKFSLDKGFLAKNEYKDVLLAFDKLKQSRIRVDKDEVTLFYPRCSNDIIKPLLLLDALTDFKKARIILADQILISESIAEAFLASTNSRKFRQFKDFQRFSFRDKTIDIFYLEGDILLNKDLPEFDIYFERAFQLFRKDSVDFIPNIIKKANKGALLITDFLDFNHKSLKKVKFPEELKSIGFYKFFGIVRKV